MELNQKKKYKIDNAFLILSVCYLESENRSCFFEMNRLNYLYEFQTQYRKRKTRRAGWNHFLFLRSKALPWNGDFCGSSRSYFFVARVYSVNFAVLL